MRTALLCLALLAACGGGGTTATVGSAPLAPDPFVNWETIGVHPLDVTPDGLLLLVCNTPAGRLEVFDISGLEPVALGGVPVGLAPVAVRARSDGEAWVVNHLSDSVSIVDLPTRRVVDTLQTLDEPADVVFAGRKAYVSCAQANAVQVFDAADPARPPATLPIRGEEPRALAVAPDGSEVYAAIFYSGNRTTVLGGGVDENAANQNVGGIGFPPNVVSDPGGPHGGVNPPPNAGGAFNPQLRPGNPPPPPVSLIVRQDAQGAWRDDTGADWTRLVSGPDAARSGRPAGWELLDHDIAIIDTATDAVRYVGDCMNICMAIAARGRAGQVLVVGTDATNEVRYEPVIRGTFLRVELAAFDPAAGAPPAVLDLNPHLTYRTPTVPQAERDLSLGDPRGIAVDEDAGRVYVTGMGSNNVVVLGDRFGRVGKVDVGAGPTGIVLGNNRARVYVLNRFDMSLSVIDTAALTETARVPLFDPTPAVIKRGRRHLYATHETSGLGHIACASCHVDGTNDRLAWDLGDPAGVVKPMNQNCLTELIEHCEDFHPMKGPMLTQTLQDIIGKEPFHWRGDRDGLEEFNDAFVTLMGDDAVLTPAEMQEFEDFLATLHFPPNPFRNPDNTLPASLPLPGHFTPGRFAPAGQPLPPGNARRGLDLYRTGSLDGGVPGFQCVTCHTLPTGQSADLALVNGKLAPLPPGPNGERHHFLVSVDGTTNVSTKVPQLRNLYERVGFELTQPQALTGFGFLHDGSVDSLARFVSEPVFNVRSDQDVADLVAFLLAFSGSDLPEGGLDTLSEPPGPPSRDTHAAVGMQVTFGGRRDEGRLAMLVGIADGGAVGLVARAPRSTWRYDAAEGVFIPDDGGAAATLADLRALAAPGNEITFTVVPKGDR